MRKQFFVCYEITSLNAHPLNVIIGYHFDRLLDALDQMFQECTIVFIRCLL